MIKGRTGAGGLSSKLLTVVTALGLLVTAHANEIYIEQVGNSSIVTITQDGADNRIGTSLSPSYIGGGSNTVTIDQVGANNELDMVVNGAGTDVIVDILGNTNISTINCGTTNSAGCSGSFIKQAIVGDSNTVTQNISITN